MYSRNASAGWFSCDVGFGELVARLAEFRILLNRVSIFDDRFGVFLLLDVGIAAAEVFALGDLGIFRATARRAPNRRADAATLSRTIFTP